MAPERLGLSSTPRLSSSRPRMMLSIEPPRDPGVGSARHFAASGCAPIAARIPWWVGGGAAVTSSGPRWEMPCILYLEDRYMQSSSGFNLGTCSFLVVPVHLQQLLGTSSQSEKQNVIHLFVCLTFCLSFCLYMSVYVFLCFSLSFIVTLFSIISFQIFFK